MKPNFESIKLLYEYDCLDIYSNLEYELLMRVLLCIKDTNDLPDNIKDLISRTLLEQLSLTKSQAWNYAHSVRCGNDYLDRDLISSNENEIGPKEKVVIEWPDSQHILGRLDEINGELINDEVGLDIYGSSAYLVNRYDYERLFKETE